MLDPAKVCDLNNDIHPVFLPILDQLSQEDGSKATPALRLASRAVQTHAAVTYMLTMSEGDMYLDN